MLTVTAYVLCHMSARKLVSVTVSPVSAVGLALLAKMASITCSITTTLAARVSVVKL